MKTDLLIWNRFKNDVSHVHQRLLSATTATTFSCLQWPSVSDVISYVVVSVIWVIVYRKKVPLIKPVVHRKKTCDNRELIAVENCWKHKIIIFKLSCDWSICLLFNFIAFFSVSHNSYIRESKSIRRSNSRNYQEEDSQKFER